MDFFTQIPRYKDDPNALARLELRHRFLVNDLQSFVDGKSVLDLAAHDGRWSYAYAAAGAKRVTGVEARRELVDQFATYPEDTAKNRVALHCDDLFSFLENEVSAGRRYDFVAVLGFLYHTMQHYRLFTLIRDLNPGCIVVDSLFIRKQNPMVQLVREAPDKITNATADFEGQEMTLTGVPSTGAMEKIADVLGYDIRWADWTTVPKDQRRVVGEYFRKGRKVRATCYLTPRT